MNITVAGKQLHIIDQPRKAPQKAQPLSARSHLQYLDHAQEIRDHIGFMEDLHDHMQFLRDECRDPWERAERDEQLLVDHYEFILHIGAVSAHVGYMVEKGEWNVLETIGMSISPDLLGCIREECPGCLTGNWQFLAREVVSF